MSTTGSTRARTRTRAAGPSRPCVLAAALIALGACGRSHPPARFVGESTHFRLYVDPALAVSPELEGENGLVALETAWSDAHTMLRMPDGKLTYYWLTPEHIAAACDAADEQACFWEGDLEIDAATLPNPHELNHAYMFLRAQREPIPFLAEGIAEAIGCEPHAPANVPDTPWPPLVVSLRSPEVYVQGGAFVRHLIRRSGVDEFLRGDTRPPGHGGVRRRHQDLPVLAAAAPHRRPGRQRSRARALLDAAAARRADAGLDGRGRRPRQRAGLRRRSTPGPQPGGARAPRRCGGASLRPASARDRDGGALPHRRLRCGGAVGTSIDIAP